MSLPISHSPYDLDIATRTVIGEADNQGDDGAAAVAWVIRTRASWNPPAWWGHSIAGVCQKKAQFSCWNGGADTDRIQAISALDPDYQRIQAIVKGVFDGIVECPVPGGKPTHYLVVGTQAEWAEHLAPGFILGAQMFYCLSPSA